MIYDQTTIPMVDFQILCTESVSQQHIKNHVDGHDTSMFPKFWNQLDNWRRCITHES